MTYNIREIESKDNAAIEQVIRTCLIEYGADHEGTAWADPFLGELSTVYGQPGSRYWVAETGDGQVVAGAGIGKLEGQHDFYTLSKFFNQHESCLIEQPFNYYDYLKMSRGLDVIVIYYQHRR